MINPRDVRVRHSSLKNMGKSPAHYLHALQNPMKSSAAMTLGSAIHSFVLGGAPVIGYSGATRRGKEWEAFAADHPGAIILTGEELERAVACRDAIKADPNVMDVLDGEREKAINWSHGGRACVSTPDVHNPGKWITDLKTTNCAKPSKFLYQARTLNYDSQLAYYDAAVGGVPDHYIVAVETTAPFPVVVFRVAPSTIEMGGALWRSWFERLRVCEDSDDWPGYSRLIETLEFPQEGDGLEWGDTE